MDRWMMSYLVNTDVNYRLLFNIDQVKLKVNAVTSATYFHRADLFGPGHGGLPVDVDGVRHQGSKVHRSPVWLVTLGGGGLLITVSSLGFFLRALVLVVRTNIYV